MAQETDHFVEEVSHWVHDEQACVTVQRIVQTFQLSWSVSLSILKEIPKHGNDYSVTFYGLETSEAAGSSGASSEVLRLVTCQFNEESQPEESASWFALALESCTESIQVACERDRAQFHDSMEEITLMEESTNLLALPEPLQRRFQAFHEKKGRSYDDAFGDVVAAPAPAKATHSGSKYSKKTVTTAKNFFAKTTTSSSTKTTASSKTKGSTATKAKPTAAKTRQYATNSHFQPKKTTDNNNNNNNNSSSANKRSADEEKENHRNKSDRRVGNADDFVGDEDEDDDDEISVESDNAPDNAIIADTSPKAAAKQRARKEDHTEEPSEEEEPTDKEEPEPKRGVQADKKTNKDGPKPRRRRKRLVEKTSTSEDGYLYTETVEVWEDIPSDEEDQFPVPSKKKHNLVPTKGSKGGKKAAKPTQMKQKTLVGFFKKK